MPDDETTRETLGAVWDVVAHCRTTLELFEVEELTEAGKAKMDQVFGKLHEMEELLVEFRRQF